VFLLDKRAGAGAYGLAQSAGVEELLKGETEAGDIERGEEEGVAAIGDDGLDGLGARSDDRALLSHELEEFDRRTI
jgi:hypothetical protein